MNDRRDAWKPNEDSELASIVIELKSKILTNKERILAIMEKIEKVMKCIMILALFGGPFYMWFSTKSFLLSFLFFVILSPATVITFFKKMNVFIISFFILFAIPASLSTFLLVILNSIYPVVNNTFFTYFYVFSIPLASLLTFFFYKRKDMFLKTLKVSLEYNNWVYASILFVLVVMSYSTNDFSKLIPTVSPETLKEQTLSDLRELFSLFLQVASFPFIIANGILKSLVEHIEYRANLNGLDKAQNS